MKQTTTLICASALSLLCGACNYVAPTPLADENAPAIVEPLPFYRSLQVFEERSVPLCYTVTASDNCPISGLVKNSLRRGEAVLAKDGSPCDVQLKVTHTLKNIKISTPVPQTRYMLNVQIFMNAPRVSSQQLLWQTEVSDQKAYASAETAQAALTQQLGSVLDTKALLADTERSLGVSVLRIATSRNLVDFNANTFETDVRSALDEVRRINGVLNVRMIEADKNNRTVSFRVLYRRDALPAGIAAKIREINATKQ